MAQIKAYAWQIAALGLAGLLLWQTLRLADAEVDAARAHANLQTERAAADRAAREHSERIRELEGAHRAELTTSRAQGVAELASARADAGAAIAARDPPLAPRAWPNSRALALMLALPSLLATGCAATSPPTSSPTVKPPKIEPLPEAARQTAAPSICSPTCSAALTTERENWRQLLTTPVPAAGDASASTTAPAR
ncbi:hypothetical protein Acica_09 [Acidovorax phage Acica]|nr:hypothetical protein Acica_09 [Acidovorax phage Acica]